ncbi:N-acetyltransferase family protein [Streptococcus timonensis]|uniref:GNAT family N-acetyltransferase n=1 Tax=Streptococcus timonensis TaxID=1852387 RepID=UPI0039C11B96
MEYDLLIREAEISDASEVIALLDQIGQESSFTSLDENGLSISESEMQIFIDKQAQSENQITLLAFLNDELAGIINVTADQRPRVRHIGDIFLGIKKTFWGSGLGSILMEEAIEWAKTSGVIRRLQLTVQKRNLAAIHLYEKMGFITEGLQERGACIERGEFLDVYLMGKLID